jgi:hypothetical protein
LKVNYADPLVETITSDSSLEPVPYLSSRKTMLDGLPTAA